jgi:uncharacterized protein
MDEVFDLIALLQDKAVMLGGPLPDVIRSPDPKDNFLLAMAEAGQADYLVTGDKSGLLALIQHGPTRILPASACLALLAAK